MEQEEKDIELIEAYHEGTLTDHALADFKKRCAEDDAFNNKVNDYIHIMKEVRSYGERVFMQTLKAWEEEISPKKEAKVIPLRKLISVAAAILIILVPLGYLLLSDFSKNDSHELFATHFQPYEDVISERSLQTGLLEQGISAYNQEDYTTAIIKFEQYLDVNQDKADIQTYLGISYLAVDQPEKAENTLKEVSQKHTGLFKEVSEWYLALTYLKSEQTDQLQQQLENIVSQKNHMFYDQAGELLSEIE